MAKDNTGGAPATGLLGGKALFNTGGSGADKGQDYSERVAKGRKEVSFWLPDAESHARLQKLTAAMGAKYPKDAIVQLLNEAFAKYGV